MIRVPDIQCSLKSFRVNLTSGMDHCCVDATAIVCDAAQTASLKASIADGCVVKPLCVLVSCWSPSPSSSSSESRPTASPRSSSLPQPLVPPLQRTSASH
mmetsp:Transcript_5073/g.11235  ORF Transcript_5073/g.11235 Transcript_5073/m.11235 type:complete len:100 (+) Transcript_5073:1033-1332(+)